MDGRVNGEAGFVDGDGDWCFAAAAPVGWASRLGVGGRGACGDPGDQPPRGPLIGRIDALVWETKPRPQVSAANWIFRPSHANI